MTCHRRPDGWICSPTYDSVKLVRVRCHDKRCRRAERWQVETIAAGYGPSYTCLHCGRQSTAADGCRVHRPLVGGRGSVERDRNIKRAQALLESFKTPNEKNEVSGNSGQLE